MSESQAPLPDDPEALVALMLDETQPQEVRNRAAEQLATIVGTIARRQLMGVFKKDESLADDATQHVMMQLSKGKFHPEKGRFVAWAKQVVCNYLLDECRRRRRVKAVSQLRLEDRNEGFDVFELLGGESVAVMSEDPSIFCFPFCEEDLNRVSSWKPLRDRIVMLVLSGLWCKVPENTWKQWVRDAELSWPFPPAAMQNLDNKQDRLQPLAEVMGLVENHLCVIWNRRREWLVQLRCIRELAEGHGHGDPSDLG